MEEAFYAIIHGRVQGVAFRYSTRQQAVNRRLKGWVRNEADGTVAVFCEGDKDSISKFKKWLEKGPPGAYVTHVDMRTVPIKSTFRSFTIEY